MQGRTFSKLQSLLGERLGRSVFLISVTTDPAKDDPAQLKSWGKRYDVQAGWTLVTGNEIELNKLLMPFTGEPAGSGMHLPATFIGNARTGVWTSASGVFDAETLLNAVDLVTRDTTVSRH
jgi:protein SCO1/2